MSQRKTDEITFEKDSGQFLLAIVKLLILAAVLAAITNAIAQEMRVGQAMILALATSTLCIPYVMILASKIRVLSVKAGDRVCRLDLDGPPTNVEYLVVEVKPRHQVVVLTKASHGTLHESYEEVTYGRMIRKYRRVS